MEFVAEGGVLREMLHENVRFEARSSRSAPGAWSAPRCFGSAGIFVTASALGSLAVHSL